MSRVLTVLAVAAGLLTAGSAQAEPLAAWVVYAAGPTLEARVITEGGPCPNLTLDGKSVAMGERAAPSERFGVRVCTIALPNGISSAALSGHPLPLPVAQPRRIVVIGDTGCRIKGLALQACNDPAAWPFAQVAAAAAREHPDLIIHVGDYLYRETPCPPLVSGCAGSPWGDNWPTWQADFFTPAQPLLAAAPWVMLRGNHEECARAGQGWTRFLDGEAFDPALACRPHGHPYAVDMGATRLLVMDDASARDTTDAAGVPVARADLATLAGLARDPSWLLTHHPIHGIFRQGGPGQGDGANGTLAAAESAGLPAAVRLALSGHIHTFEVENFAGQPPQLITGDGGDALDTSVPADLSGLAVGGVTVHDGLSLDGFGYTVMTAMGDGWSITRHHGDGTVSRTCAFTAGRIDCSR